MLKITRFITLSAVITSCLFLVSCGAKKLQTLPTTLPPTDHVEITFTSDNVPGDCRVFAHLLISMPSGMSEDAVRQELERYGSAHGADYLLIGKVRESGKANPGQPSYSVYGPSRPYSFSTAWPGWKFGFDNWNSRGPLVDFGKDQLFGNRPAFDIPVLIQAVLLSCENGT